MDSNTIHDNVYLYFNPNDCCIPICTDIVILFYTDDYVCFKTCTIADKAWINPILSVFVQHRDIRPEYLETADNDTVIKVRATTGIEITITAPHKKSKIKRVPYKKVAAKLLKYRTKYGTSSVSTVLY